MIADDCTYLDMEIYGGQAKTPNLNKLAREGLTFTRCFQTAPMCSPGPMGLGEPHLSAPIFPDHTSAILR